MSHKPTRASKTSREIILPSLQEEDFVVKELRDITRNVALDYSRNVGRVVIHNVYGGSLDGWRKRGKKCASFRRLARHPELPMSPSALYRCVALFAMFERIGSPEKWPHLGVAHFRCVLAIPEAYQTEILERANQKRWTVRELESVCRQQLGVIRASDRAFGSRCEQRLKELARWAEEVERCARDSGAPQLEDGALENHARKLDELKSWLSQMRTLIEPETKG